LIWLGTAVTDACHVKDLWAAGCEGLPVCAVRLSLGANVENTQHGYHHSEINGKSGHWQEKKEEEKKEECCSMRPWHTC